MIRQDDIYNPLVTFINNDFNGELSHMTVLVGGTREGLCDALRTFTRIDSDFNGENGDDYLIDPAREKGFDSNLEYYISELDQYEDDEQAIQFFMDKWLGADYHYESYSVNIIKDSDGKIKVLSLDFTSDC